MRRDESYLFWKNVLKVAPRQLNLYEKALIHASKMPKVGENNERLEFLGDAVLDMVVADLLYEAYPMDSEGELTKKKN
jgi:ribonuclease-3